MKTICFDIETAPLPESELAAMMPTFDPAEVKCGNIKDPDKIAAKLAEAEARHKQDFLDRAALDPLTGQVLVIGTYTTKDGFLYYAGKEKDLLFQFWELCRDKDKMVGFNIRLFDLPFLVRRSWKHRIFVPGGIRNGRYWADEIIDLRECWQLGDRQAPGSLDSIARHLGIGAKTGNGKDFASLWASDQAKAIDYLKNDLELTCKMAQVMGVITEWE